MIGSLMDRDGYHKDRIRQKAEKKNGGVTTTYKAITETKMVSQKYMVGDLVTIEHSRSGFRIHCHEKLGKRLNETAYFKFIQELVDTLQDCGYDIAVGDTYFEVIPV